MPLSEVTDKMVVRHAESLATVTYLDISYCSKITSKGLEAFGKGCKSLVHLKRNMPPTFIGTSIQETACKIDDSEAMVISETMPGIKMLELCNGCFGNSGLKAILNKCKALTHLDVEGCSGVFYEEELEKICNRLVIFRSPWDEDYFSDYFDNDAVGSSEDDAASYDVESSPIDSV